MKEVKGAEHVDCVKLLLSDDLERVCLRETC